ncbi:hypothetical protein THRCLA_09458 [Thraustotheca clavata]|uniref:Uncharacterized protein n=1 Tax=Thraustotheca clavata TaxID=74557 RepID=A0A1V9YW20_9STRA|nr:hypothetical protein THRCLA_09458 [Thraustotheca clavata]
MVIALLAVVQAVQFDIKRRAEKCLSDEIAAGSLVVVHYNILGNVKGRTGVSLLIKDPLGKYLKEDSDIDLTSEDIHKFSFNAETAGTYSTCFFNSNDVAMRVSLDFKHGVEAKDYSDIAKREHLMPVEKELRKMEDTVDEIHREMLYMREREAAMRNTNESTNSRVLWFSSFSIFVLLAMGLWQVIVSPVSFMLPPSYTSKEISQLFLNVAKHVEELNHHTSTQQVSMPSDNDIASWIANNEEFTPAKHPLALIQRSQTQTNCPVSPKTQRRSVAIKPGKNSMYTLVAGKQRSISLEELTRMKTILRQKSFEIANGKMNKLNEEKQILSTRRRRKAIVPTHFNDNKANTAGKQALISELIHTTTFTMEDIFQMSCQFKDLAMANGTITSDKFTTIIGNHLGKLVSGANLPGDHGVSTIGETISSSTSLIKRLYQVFDKDGNGTIDFREFIIGLNSLVKGTLEQKLDTLFALYDKDGSGTISVSELVLILNGGQEKMSQLAVYIDNYFATVDTNGDNVITEEEFATAAVLEPLVLEALTKSLAFNRHTTLSLRQSLRCFCDRTKVDWSAMLSMLEDLNDTTRIGRETEQIIRRFSSESHEYIAPMALLSIDQFQHLVSSYYADAQPEDNATLHDLFQSYNQSNEHSGKINAREFLSDLAGFLR